MNTCDEHLLDDLHRIDEMSIERRCTFTMVLINTNKHVKECGPRYLALPPLPQVVPQEQHQRMCFHVAGTSELCQQRQNTLY